jgi:hypothetical protein
MCAFVFVRASARVCVRVSTADEVARILSAANLQSLVLNFEQELAALQRHYEKERHALQHLKNVALLCDGAQEREMLQHIKSVVLKFQLYTDADVC